MSSIQERLQLKRVPLDTWNVREQLCLASAVVRSGDQNWMSVSRALKTVGDPNRPADWYSQKSCAAQYGALLEHVETPKRKKRSSEGAVETPQESIFKRLTQERIAEIQKTVNELNQQYQSVKADVLELRNPGTSEDRVKEIWVGIETGKRTREREQMKRAAWLKEREERRARAERPWRPGGSPNSSPSAIPPASPLLTSLLKSSPVVTTPQHITHPANVVDTVSPSVGAPTLSMLLDKQPPSTAHESKDAAIEIIKSQLVQIEQQFIASTTSPSPAALVAPVTVALPDPTPPVDKIEIDDIEIKAEDVYAFSDIDIDIPPVSSIHKTQITRSIDKPAFTKKDGESPPLEETTLQQPPLEQEEALPAEDNPVSEATSDVSVENTVSHGQLTMSEREPEPAVRSPEAAPVQVKVSFPEVKFPTPEIKVIQSDEHKTLPREEPKEVEPVQEVVKIENEESVDEVPPAEEITPAPVEEPAPTPPLPASPPAGGDAEGEAGEEEAMPVTEDIPLPPDAPRDDANAGDDLPETTQEVLEPKLEVEEPVEEKAPEDAEPGVEPAEAEPAEENETEEPVVVKSEREDDIMESPSVHEAGEVAGTPIKEDKPSEPEDTHTETDDDTPMELSREEEKDGKKKRDYSRKKKSDSRTWSGSESAPESPAASTDLDKQHRLWKKSVMLVYSRLCAHKYASLFLRPITDEQAPGYSLVVKRPMDLTTIKRNIDSGVTRTTAEFQRDVLLMLSNALMYNSTNHRVYQMAKEMHQEAEAQLGMLLQAQAHAALGAAPPPPAPRAASPRAPRTPRAARAPRAGHKRRAHAHDRAHPKRAHD